MIKNKEFFWLYTVLTTISVVCSLILFQIDKKAGLVGAACFFVLLISTYIFSKIRYNKITKLSNYLADVYSGNDVMDIRDNTEGELSILKNDIYKVTTALSESTKLLKKDKEYLADTLSNISHQLKTPLTSMMVMADLLSDSKLSDERRKDFTERIISQLNRLEWLVSALLRIAKIDAGTIVFKKDSVNLSELIDKSIEPLLIPAELKNIQINVSCPENLNIITDKNWTAEAFINIIKNCIEHTADIGKITIMCTETALYTQVKITDTGEGISKEDLSHIFERFYKGKNAGVDSVGIGLAMSKTIFNSQLAEVTIESELGVGTAFSIKFYAE